MVEKYSRKHEYMIEDTTTGEIVCICNPPRTNEGCKMAEYIVKLMNQDVKLILEGESNDTDRTIKSISST